jgi:hypothetical protein
VTTQFYTMRLLRRGRPVENGEFTDALDLRDVETARTRLYLLLRAAIVRCNGDLRDSGEYALELREHGGRDVLMTYATHGEVQL